MMSSSPRPPDRDHRGDRRPIAATRQPIPAAQGRSLTIAEPTPIDTSPEAP